MALLITYNLEAEGYVVESVARGDEAELRLAENAPDLLILDWLLPGISGIEICRRLRAREATRTLPVIMVTARLEESERVRGLAVGADDYVGKPFSVIELMARVRALLRRSRPERIAERLYVGNLDLIDLPGRVRRGDRDIRLAPTDFRLLGISARKAGRVFSRAQLLDLVWGRSAEVDERTVDVHIGRLRKRLSKGRERDPIRTVRGAGYAIDEGFGPERSAVRSDARLNPILTPTGLVLRCSCEARASKDNSRMRHAPCLEGVAPDIILNRWGAVSWAARRSISSFVPMAAIMPASRDAPLKSA